MPLNVAEQLSGQMAFLSGGGLIQMIDRALPLTAPAPAFPDRRTQSLENERA